MKAMVYHEYGTPDNLELLEIEMPAVVDDGVLVKVRAASVNWHDWHFLSGTPPDCLTGMSRRSKVDRTPKDWGRPSFSAQI